MVKKPGTNRKKQSGGGCIQVGGQINFQTIYEWILRMISNLFYGTKKRYRWTTSGKGR